MKPKPVTQQRLSVASRVKRESILYESTPDTIKQGLPKDAFELIPSKNLSQPEIDALIQLSMNDDHVLVGYLIELFSKSTGKSKGLFVVMGVKKFRFSATSYLLKNKEQVERWTVLHKEVNKNVLVNGKPVKVLRKVATFI